MFLVTLPDREKETLIAIICAHVAPYSTIYTDGWSSYRELGAFNGFNVRVWNWAGQYLSCAFQYDWVNHSENYVQPNNPEVHTQTIESTWFRIKRTLPRSGNYSLSQHLPVFLWKVHCRQNGQSPFIELLRLLGNPRYASIEEECDPTPVPSKLKFPCLYCTREFKTEKLLKDHLNRCKTRDQALPEEQVPETEYPCATCEEIFNDKALFKVHSS